MDIPLVRMPTEEELFVSYSAVYERAAHTFIDNWPDDVRALSMPTILVPLDPDLLIKVFDDTPDRMPATKLIAGLIDDAMGWDQQWFVRLNSRSPKDATAPGFPITCSGKQAVWWLASSERALDDTCMLRGARKPLYVCLREWRHMWPDGEFRCFAKDGRLRGVSRYFYDRAPAFTVSDERLWEAAERFYQTHLSRHYPDIVFDLHDPLSAEPLLIEINPYGLSDPCCFAGSYEEIETVGGVRQSRPPTTTGEEG